MYIFFLFLLSFIPAVCLAESAPGLPSVLKRLTPHIYYLPHYMETDRPVLAVIYGQEKSLVVDAGNSPAHANLFLSAIKKLPGPAPKYLVVTHWHWDHVFGISTMNMTTIAHEKTNTELKKLAIYKWDDKSLDQRVKDGIEIDFCRINIKKEMPDPRNFVVGTADKTFKDKMELDLGGLTCIIEHVGGDHAAGSSVVFVPEDKVVFTGDCIYPDYYDGPPYFTREKLFPMLDKLLSYEANYYVDSHMEPISFEQMKERCDLAKKIGNLVADETDDRKAAKKYQETYKKAPDDTEKFFIVCFTNGNNLLAIKRK